MSVVLFRKPDLDTVTAAYVLGVGPEADLRFKPAAAGAEDLADPTVVCIECGGSGGAAASNFDHHEIGLDLPPACVQALGVRPRASSWQRALVAYAAAVDEGRRVPGTGARPTLSGLISGIRLALPEPAAAMRAGLEALRECEALRADPRGPLPVQERWRRFLEAKAADRAALVRALAGARLVPATPAVSVGYLETRATGVHGALRRLGCTLSVAATPPLGEAGVRRYTVASSAVRLDGLLAFLRTREQGWGGPCHGSILGSPLGGSRLAPAELLDAVLVWARNRGLRRSVPGTGALEI